MRVKVQEVQLENEPKKYLLVNNKGMPIVQVGKYLKYLDTTGKSSNTQKTYAYSLKLYFEYLEQININFKEVNIYLLSNFVGWLRNPYVASNITTINPRRSKRTEKSINLTITVVSGFYDYLYRIGELNDDIVDKLMKRIFTGGHRTYKNFLYHITKSQFVNKNILMIKVPKQRIKVLTREEVEKIFNASTNIRDKFLIQLLFETGLRIGEALSLFIEDIIYDDINGHKINIVNRGELKNGAKIKTPSSVRTINISNELMDFYQDYAYDVLDELEVDTNFVFVKIKGKNKGQPLQYTDVSDLFKRLRKKTGIDVHPHILRHTHATLFYQATKDIKATQERLGHSQIQTTINLYVHPSDEEMRKNWSKAKKSFELEKGEY